MDLHKGMLQCVWYARQTCTAAVKHALLRFQHCAIAASIIAATCTRSQVQVLCQEMLRYNRLTAVVRASLQNLERAIKGLQVRPSPLG